TPSDAPAGAAKRALVTIRIEKLLQGGLIDDAGSLAAALHLDNDPDFTRVQAEALLYAGRDKDICGDLTATRLTSPDPFWLELRDYCFVASGDSASAELAHAALEGLGVKDPAFDVLVADALTGAKKPVPAIDHPTALHIFLMRKAGLVVTNAMAAKLGTVANMFAARDPRNPPADRLAAASRIAATGALGNAELLSILNTQVIPAKDLAQAQAVSAKLLFLPAQGLLRRAALLETRPPAKTDLVLAALSAGGHPGRLPQTAALQGVVALAIKPAPTIAAGRLWLVRCKRRAAEESRRAGRARARSGGCARRADADRGALARGKPRRHALAGTPAQQRRHPQPRGGGFAARPQGRSRSAGARYRRRQRPARPAGRCHDRMRPRSRSGRTAERGARAGGRGVGDAMNDAALFESFLDMMSAERGASINTLAAYRRDLLDFANRRAAKRGNARAASREDIRAYLVALTKSGIAGSTQARRLSALRQFFVFLYTEGIRKDDPTDAIDAPRRQRPLPKILSRADIEALIEAARAGAPDTA